MAVSGTFSPASILAISATRSAPVSSRTAATVRPSRSLFSARKWREAHAATCGTCVTQSTWACRANRRSLPPPASAVRPPCRAGPPPPPALEGVLEVGKLVFFGPEPGEQLQRLGRRDPILALQTGELLESGLDRCQPLRVALDTGGSIARKGCQIRDAPLELFGLLEPRPLSWIERGELRKRPDRLPEPLPRRALPFRPRLAASPTPAPDSGGAQPAVPAGPE